MDPSDCIANLNVFAEVTGRQTKSNSALKLRN